MLDKAKNKGEPKPYLRNLNVRWFEFDLSDVLEMPFLPTEVEKYTAVKGDVLICEGGYPGRAAIWGKDEPIYFQKALHRVRFHEPERNRWFLYYLLSKDLDGTLKNHFNGAGIQHFTGEALAQFEVPLPPLAEQQRIVGLLDEAFEGLATAKANAEKNLQNARALFESHLQAVLRNKKWKWKTLGDLCNDVEYGSSAKSKAKAAGGVPVLRMGNIQDGRLDWGNLVYTDDKAEIKKYLLKHNDVLFNRTNSPELVGKTAIYKGEMPAIFAGYLIRIHRKEDLLDADFLTYFLNSQIAFDHGKTVVISSVNQANINGTKLKSYPIPAPPLAEQKAIVEELDALSAETQRLASLYERKLAALEALKKALLHQAFAGEL
ncbi:MAG: restriction endonuclease subunit S [Prosthecobacter sp.]|nr:restriction endonuclease subunit S [Prosthecobacter sp.]